MDLLRELEEHKFNIFSAVPHIYCKSFEDNSGTIELARLPTMRSRTTHINQLFQHFMSYVKKGLVKVLPI